MRDSVWLGAVLLFCSGQFLSAQEVDSVQGDAVRSDADAVAPAQATARNANTAGMTNFGIPIAGTVAVDTDAVDTATVETGATDSVTTVPTEEPLINPADAMNGGNLIFQQQDEPVLVAPDTAAYQFYITDLENRHGASSPRPPGSES